MISPLVLAAAAFVTAAVGAVGGLGGAVLLVPALVIGGMAPSMAAPLGLLSVAAGSVAAGSRQLVDRAVNHRIGVTTELVATTGAVMGAMVSNIVPDRALVIMLAVVALGAAVAGGRRKGLRNPPDPTFLAEDVGERVGALTGAYPVGGAVVPYRPRNLPVGLSLMGLAGLVAGTAGVSGGFIKTPAMSEVMHIPTKVAASTTTFTIGITAAAALVVFAIQGRIDATAGAGIIFGSLAGGWVGAHLQARLAPAAIRRLVSAVLIIIAVLLVVFE